MVLKETYIDMLVKYKSDLERPFDEATDFLNKIEIQLSNLSTTSLSGQSLFFLMSPSITVISFYVVLLHFYFIF